MLVWGFKSYTRIFLPQYTHVFDLTHHDTLVVAGHGDAHAYLESRGKKGLRILIMFQILF